MAPSRYLISLLLPWLAVAGPLPENTDLSAGTDAVVHANHIFNAVHNSMRQFGSSLNHNGMSLFIATVPEGTELYHGTSKEYRVNGTQWLAFEPEHASIFARGRGPPPGRRPPGEGPPGNGPDGHGPPPFDMTYDEPEGHHPPPGYGPPHHSKPYEDDDAEPRPGKDKGGKKHHGDKGRPGKHHGDEDRPGKHHSSPCNGSRPDAPHHPHPPPPPPHRGPPPPPHHDGPPPPPPPHHDHPPPPHDGRPPPPPPHHGGPPPPPDHDHPPPPPHNGRPPPPPHHGGPPPPPHHDGPPPPPHDGHPPPPPHHGPPHEDFDHHGPPREGFEHHGPPPSFEHHGPPREGPGSHGPPSGFFEHHGPPREGFEHHGPPREEHHAPPPRTFKGFPPHDLREEVERQHREEQEHEHRGFSLPPVGFWAKRLGDMLRNPKRRNASPPPPPVPAASSQPEARDAEQEPLVEDAPSHDAPKHDAPPERKSGYLHTYRTKHALRLLYVDGQSAAKSKKGTLDTQDVLLLDDSIDHDSGMFGENERANKMCQMAHEQWGDHVDGILRMEGGFEIILCDFAAHLDVVRITKASPNGGGPGASGEDGFNYYRAVAARYHGIGGGRVVLDYEHFVTAFAYPDAVQFDKTGRPRLNNGSEAVNTARQAVNKMVLRKGNDLGNLDWQSVADQIVARYADRIEFLASGSLSTLESLQDEIDRALRPFIDYSARNSTLETERCAAQFIPFNADTTTVAARAVQEVASHLCSSLVSASAQDDYEDALAVVRDLKRYLAWTTWKQCRGCSVDEICFLPIWPVGTTEDFEQPKCRSSVSMGPGHGGYWNDFGGPGGPRHHRGGEDKKVAVKDE